MMKANPMTLMAFVLALAALYMLMLRRPQPKKVKSVRFVEKEEVVRERPAPAHMQADPNSRLW